MPSEKQVVRSGPLAKFIANGVRKGDAIYLSGQVSIDDDGHVVGAGDLPAQVEQAYAHVAAILDELGASMSDIVDETWFLTDMNAAMGNIAPVFAARTKAYGGEPDVTQTMIAVSALAFPELMIEIKVIAHV